jgi:hypothetical protein
MKKLIILLFLVVIIFTSGCLNQNRPETTTTVTQTTTSTILTTISLDKRRSNPYPSLSFNIDCSHLNSKYQDDCQTFITNQEKYIYPELKRLTGINLTWCYDKVSYVIYPTTKELFCNEDEGGCAFPFGGIQILPEFSINTTCKIDVHQLQHVFDWCIEQNYNIREAMAESVILTTYMSMCPPYYESVREEADKKINTLENNPTLIEDCKSAQDYAILKYTYNLRDSFLHRFYEWLLQKNLSVEKTESDITEAIYYGSNYESNFFVKKYCIGDIAWLDTLCKDKIIDVVFQNPKKIDLTNLCEFWIDDVKIKYFTFDLSKNRFELNVSKLTGEHKLKMNCYGQMNEKTILCQ